MLITEMRGLLLVMLLIRTRRVLIQILLDCIQIVLQSIIPGGGRGWMDVGTVLRALLLEACSVFIDEATL